MSYRVCLIEDGTGRILARDAMIIGGEHGVFKRINEASKLPILKPRPVPRPTGDFVEDLYPPHCY